MPVVRLVQRQGLAFWSVPEWESLGYRCAFFQRMGGVSQAPYTGLNLGLTTEDVPAQVRENRRRALQAAELGPLLPALGQQVHGAHVQVVTVEQSGRGWLDPATAFPGTDALISAVRGLPVGVAIADCLPVLLVAEGRLRVAAAIHAGWKGLAQSILAQTIERMGQQWNIPPSLIRAAVGPGIGPERFCIRGEVLERLRGQYPEALVREDHFRPVARFDLWEAAKTQLVHAGIPSGQIILIRECTASHPEQYFSYRRDGKQTGRMLGLVQIQN